LVTLILAESLALTQDLPQPTKKQLWRAPQEWSALKAPNDEHRSKTQKREMTLGDGKFEAMGPQIFAFM
jgi:hypothetical protein